MWAKKICAKSQANESRNENIVILTFYAIFELACVCVSFRVNVCAVLASYIIWSLYTPISSQRVQTFLFDIFVIYFAFAFFLALLCIYVYYAHVFHKQFSPKQKMWKIVILFPIVHLFWRNCLRFSLINICLLFFLNSKSYFVGIFQKC